MVNSSTTQMVTTNSYNQLLKMVTTDYCTMICLYRARKIEATYRSNLLKLDFTYRQLVTILESAHIGSGRGKPLFGATC